jgi:CRISPR-associated endonuclease/helicase Cas3
MDRSGDPLLLFWGKARPGPEARTRWHPCLYHEFDVAAVGEVILGQCGETVERMAGACGWGTSQLRRLIVFLLSMHDIGKFSRQFQAQCSDLYPVKILGKKGYHQRPLPHSDVGHSCLLDHFTLGDEPTMANWSEEAVAAMLAPFTGHHGRPPRSDRIPRYLIGEACLSAVAKHVDLCRRLFAPDAMPPPDIGALRRWSWWLAGLAVLSDWIGSNQHWFPYHEPNLAPEDYWNEIALPRAREAVRRAGIEPARVSARSGFRAITGLGVEPSPLQKLAEDMEIPEGPTLIIVEDVTGSGKTEAALVLAHRLARTGRARGFYFALPTMATANAMYDRLSAVLRRLFDEGSRPSLALAHSAARFHPGFRAAILEEEEAGSSELPLDPEAAEALGDLSSAYCSGWIADSSRKAFLADIGVGTVDQALLAALPVRYQALRLAGLCERVLIVDEAHAYDSYMGMELEGLLRFQAALGGHAVVLSATLPESRRRHLLAVWTGEKPEAGSGARTPYPLVTVATSAETRQIPVRARPDIVRDLTVEHLRTEDEVLERIREAADRGAAVAWIRNTVEDALDAFATLSEQETHVELFHARFALGHRLAIERRVVERFGRNGRPEGRKGVLIATQVIEQSLDVDFDLVISDLAPVDLLLQRAGRLWRHRRERPVRGPVLAVYGPDPVDEPGRDWYAALFPRAAHVYRNHALLWSTARLLFSRPKWHVPEDVRTLVEGVYGIDEAALPAGLERNWIRVEGEERAAAAVAAANLLSPDVGYEGQPHLFESEERYPTRIGEPTRTLRLAHVAGNAIRPLCEAEDERLSWALSEVRVPEWHAKEAPIPDALRRQAETVRKGWRTFDRDKLLVLMEPAGDGSWCGRLVDERGRRTSFRYDDRTGLSWGIAAG